MRNNYEASEEKSNSKQKNGYPSRAEEHDRFRMENGNAHDKTGLESKTRQNNGSAADEVPRMEMVTRMGYFRCKTPLPQKPDKECGHHEWKNKRRTLRQISNSEHIQQGHFSGMICWGDMVCGALAISRREVHEGGQSHHRRGNG